MKNSDNTSGYEPNRITQEMEDAGVEAFMGWEDEHFPVDEDISRPAFELLVWEILIAADLLSRRQPYGCGHSIDTLPGGQLVATN